MTADRGLIWQGWWPIPLDEGGVQACEQRLHLAQSLVDLVANRPHRTVLRQKIVMATNVEQAIGKKTVSQMTPVRWRA